MRLHIVVWAFAVLVAQSATANPYFGKWVTQGHSAQVLVEGCSHDSRAVCGTITWLWTPVDERGEPVRDSKNPDPRLRERPVLGMVLLQDLREDAHALTNGRIYNPENGRSYNVSMRMRSDDLLEVKGCVLFLCETQIWRRLESICR